MVSVAVVGAGPDYVFEGDEPDILHRLDSLLDALPAGVIITWNGGGFDMPFLHDRAKRHGVDLGLHVAYDPVIASREPIPGHRGGYRARWYQHRHLDGYQVYRADVGASLRWSCGLKPLARTVGLPVIEVDRERIHLLEPEELRAYVVSDAYLARELVTRRWANACLAIDRLDQPLLDHPLDQNGVHNVAPAQAL